MEISLPASSSSIPTFSIKDESLGTEDVLKALKSVKSYLSSYFSQRDMALGKQRLEDIRIEEFRDQGEEADLEALLDDLQSL